MLEFFGEANVDFMQYSISAALCSCFLSDYVAHMGFLTQNIPFLILKLCLVLLTRGSLYQSS